MFAFVKSFRYLPGENRIHCAGNNEYDRVEECDRVGRVHVRVAHQHVVLASGMVPHGASRVHHLPHCSDHNLRCITLLNSTAFVYSGSIIN